MRNLQKANARRKKLGAYPRPWRSEEESLMIKRLVWWWLTSRDNGKPPRRNWARQLGVSHTWVQKLVRELEANPDEARRLQAYGDPKLDQLGRAREHTQRMRDHGDLRGPQQRADKALGNRMKEAVLAHLAGRPHGSTARQIAMAIHVWPRKILRHLRRYERLDLIRARRRAWRPMVWEITPRGRVRLSLLETKVAKQLI
jgi:DNA-binding transcriptional ArsR family regulator